MDLTLYVDRVRRELTVAAEAGGPDAVELADRLTAPLTSALRLALLDALSTATDEITRELAPGAVEVRLRGGEPSFAVTAPAVGHLAPPLASPMAPSEPEEEHTDVDSATARINLRLPEQLKARIEEAAAAQGRSVNAWLTRVASAALRTPSQTTTADSASSVGRWNQHYTGWVS
jgi:hypothetical protein